MMSKWYIHYVITISILANFVCYGADLSDQEEYVLGSHFVLNDEDDDLPEETVFTPAAAVAQDDVPPQEPDSPVVVELAKPDVFFSPAAGDDEEDPLVFGRNRFVVSSSDSFMPPDISLSSNAHERFDIQERIDIVLENMRDDQGLSVFQKIALYKHGIHTLLSIQSDAVFAQNRALVESIGQHICLLQIRMYMMHGYELYVLADYYKSLHTLAFTLVQKSIDLFRQAHETLAHCRTRFDGAELLDRRMKSAFKLRDTLIEKRYENNDSSEALVPSSLFSVQSLSAWITACKALPYNRSGDILYIDSAIDLVTNAHHNGLYQAGLTTEEEMVHELDILTAVFIEQQKRRLFQNSKWFNKERLVYDMSDIVQALKHDVDTLPYAYVEKKIVAPGSQWYMHGDYHGDIVSCVTWFELLRDQGIIDDQFKIIPQDVYFAFLGDYVDRGKFGLEVLYTILRLAIQNPNKVILIRGNHEEYAMNKQYGFYNELGLKISRMYAVTGDDSSVQQIYDAMQACYACMPLALYVGCKNDRGGIEYIQCCHGGLDRSSLGLMQSFLRDRNVSYAQLKNCNKNNGFMWTDFAPSKNSVTKESQRGNGIYCFSHDDTNTYLNDQSTPASDIWVRGIIRGHQHKSDPSDRLMKYIIESKGIYKMWRPVETQVGDHQHRIMHDGLVWTANVAPDSIYGYRVKFNFDTYIKVVPRTLFQDWKMFVYNITIPFDV